MWIGSVWMEDCLFLCLLKLIFMAGLQSGRGGADYGLFTGEVDGLMLGGRWKRLWGW